MLQFIGIKIKKAPQRYEDFSNKMCSYRQRDGAQPPRWIEEDRE